MSSLFNVVTDMQRQIYPPQSFEQQISLIARYTTMHIYIGGTCGQKWQFHMSTDI